MSWKILKLLDMCDPGNRINIRKGWNEWRDFMVVQGPTKRLLIDYNFPKNGVNRYFRIFTIQEK